MKLRWGKEAQAARRGGRALVALETSVVAQGLPWPANLETALACEDEIRRMGATPATLAILDGAVCVGLGESELRALAQAGSSAMKVASRDLCAAMATGRSGGTTVSASVMIAAAAGIQVFSTGGIGGVHRGEAMDVSQDLKAIADNPVAVVCAGAKSVLDLSRTLEALETLEVPVVGIGTRRFPGFYVRDSGLALEHSIETPEEGARWLQARFVELSQGGMVLALPPPEATALEPKPLEARLKLALEAAAVQQIEGKAITPFLLAELARLTKGKSLEANVALLRQNAAFSARLAVAYAARVKKSPRRRAAKGS